MTRIIFWMLVVQSAIGAVPALLVWRPVPDGLWPWLLVVAFCGTFSHFCMARAMHHAEATVVVPMDFLRVPLVAIVAWLLYAERLDALTVIGAALVLATVLPNSVKCVRPRSRRTNGPPSSASRFLMARVRVGWETPQRFAACVKFSASANAGKYRIC